jgi:hypothetical protein
MAAKLTLRIDEKLIHRAKTHARRSGRSVSRLVADFFVLLGAGSKEGIFEIAPKVKSLRGVFRGAALGPESHKKHREDKFL